MNRKYERGLVVGKFCPMHYGHELVINTALAMCKEVVVLSYTSRDLGYPGEVRLNAFEAVWPKDIFPATFLVVESDEKSQVPADDASDYSHRKFCAGILSDGHGIQALNPHAVFSSEAYGDGFAEYLSDHFGYKIVHEVVDLKRTLIPISGTQLRKMDPKDWNYLVNPKAKRVYDEYHATNPVHRS